MGIESADNFTADQARAVASAVLKGSGRESVLHAANPAASGDASLFTVQAAVFPEALSLRREVEITRAALLYADRVRLVSPSAAMLFVLKDLQQLPREGQMTVLELALPILNPSIGPMVRQLRGLLNQRHLAGQALLLRERLRRELSQQWEPLAQAGRRLWVDGGGRELDEAIQAGVLSIGLVAEAVEGADAIPDAFVDELAMAVKDKTATPLFDDGTSVLVREMIEANRFSLPELSARRAAKAGIASGLVGQLPTFPTSTMAQVLEVREELAKSVAPFRKAVARLAERVESRAYEADFPEEVVDLYRDEVAPAFVEIESELKRGRVAEALGTAASGAPAPIVSYVVSTVTHLPASVAAALIVGSWTAAAGATWFQRHSGREDHARQNGFYLLYGANEAWR